jgi:uridine kinase
MHTLIRDSQTTKHDFVFYADRLIRLVGLCSFEPMGHLMFSLLGFFNYFCYSSRFLHLDQVVEHGLGHLPFTEKQVITPTGKLVLMYFCGFLKY